MAQLGSSRPEVVVGGGLAGLAAATLIARGGRQVVLYERASQLGGRALTQEERGFCFNLGPHALYRAGAGIAVLRGLGIEPQGGVPEPSGGHAVARGTTHTLPAGPISLLTTGLLRLPEKFEVARLLASIGRIDTAPLGRTTVAAWLAREVRQPEVRELVAALVRLATYTNAPEQMSAGTALRQLQLALSNNVLYLDGGWQTLVDGLRAAAETAGVRLVPGTRVARVEEGGEALVVHLADGTRQPAARVIMALAPGEAAALVDGAAASALRAWSEAAAPVRAACLDVALARLPRPRSTFALGVDRPLYLSVHSAVARLAPAGGATVAVAKYLSPDATGDGRADERELEALLHLVQPGWREVVVARRFLPRLTVMHAMATAAQGGAAGRPGPAIPAARRLYVAGDWVGPEGLLADASLASAAAAARLVLGEAAAPASAAA